MILKTFKDRMGKEILVNGDRITTAEETNGINDEPETLIYFDNGAELSIPYTLNQVRNILMS